MAKKRKKMLAARMEAKKERRLAIKEWAALNLKIPRGSKSSLAALVGCSSVTANKDLRELEEEGFLRWSDEEDGFVMALPRAELVQFLLSIPASRLKGHFELYIHRLRGRWDAPLDLLAAAARIPVLLNDPEALRMLTQILTSDVAVPSWKAYGDNLADEAVMFAYDLLVLLVLENREFLHGLKPSFFKLLADGEGNVGILSGNPHFAQVYDAMVEGFERLPVLQESPFYRAMLALASICRLRFRFAQRLLEGLPEDDWHLPFLQGLLELYTGSMEKARELFGQALKLSKGKSRKRKIFLPHPMGLVYPMVLYLGTSAQKEEARRMVKLFSKGHPLSAEFGLIGRLFEVMEGLELGVRPEYFYEGIDMGTLFRLWMWLLAGPCQDEEEIAERVRRWADQFQEAGLHLFELECRAALARKGDSEAAQWLEGLEEKKGIRALNSRLPMTERWQRQLERLKQLAESAGEGQGRAQEPTTRLAWFLREEGEKIVITPKEQRLGKRGWTKGRVVALKRLREQDPALPITAKDREVIRQIAAEPVEHGWSRVMHYFLPHEALLALAGHDLVFWEEDGRRAVVRKGEPTVVVKRKGKGFYHLTLEPPPTRSLLAGVVPRVLVRRQGDEVVVYPVTSDYVQVAQVVERNGVMVPVEGVDQLKEVASLLSRRFTLLSELEAAEIRQMEPDRRLYVLLREEGSGLSISIRVHPMGLDGPAFHPGRGQETVIGRMDGEPVQVVRDLEGEREALERLFREVPVLADLPGGDFDLIAHGMESSLEVVEGLQRVRPWVVPLWWRQKEIRVVPVRSLSLLSLTSKGDGFQLQGELEVEEGENIPLQKVVEGMEQGVGRFVPLEEGTYLAFGGHLTDLLETVEDIGHLARVSRKGMAIHPLRALVLAESRGLDTQGDPQWRELRERFRRAFDLQAEPPPGLEAQLREYQLEGYQWLMQLYEAGLGACLADDMGLGKTIQTLALLLARADRGPSLVVAPASVVSVWMGEARRFAPSLEMVELGGLPATEERRRAVEEAGPHTVVVVSYGLLQRGESASLLAEKEWNAVVLDEAQHVKNHLTRRAKAVYGLKARFRLATTGTPIENRLSELWAIFHFLNPGYLGGLEEFKRRFILPIEQYGDRRAKRRLRRLIRPMLLRRTKAEVLDDLPPKTEINMVLEFSPEERALYERMRQEAVRAVEGEGPQEQKRFQILAYLTKLRELCCSHRLLGRSKAPETKLAALEELVEEVVAGGHKVLIFSQFVRFLDLVEERLKGAGFRLLRIDGSTPSAQRTRRIKRFQAGEADAFLLSLKAGGFGINLTRADYVVLTDPWWNPAVEDQAADRAHRMGQTRPVTIYRLVMKETIEEKILELHRRKRGLSQDILADAGRPGGLSLEELVALLS